MAIKNAISWTCGACGLLSMGSGCHQLPKHLDCEMRVTFSFPLRRSCEAYQEVCVCHSTSISLHSRRPKRRVRSCTLRAPVKMSGVGRMKFGICSPQRLVGWLFWQGIRSLMQGVRQDLKGAAGTGRVIRIVDERAGFCTSREESAVSRRTIACRVQY